MSETDFDCSMSSIKSSISEDPPPTKRNNLAYSNKKKGYCNCRICKTCHPNQPKLTQEEIQIIIKRAAQNKNQKQKRCTKECAYFQRVIERKNYYLNQQEKLNNDKIKGQITENVNKENQKETKEILRAK